MTHEISRETQPHLHISPSIMIKVHSFPQIKLQILWTFVFHSFSFPLQPPPLSPSAISSLVFKQTAISFRNFSTNKEEVDADADAYAEVRSRFVAFLP